MKEFKIKTEVNVKSSDVADLLCNAIEGGSNYWCKSIDRMAGITKEQAEFRHEVPFVEGGWLKVVEYEPYGNNNWHRLDLFEIEKGLQVMAQKFPKHFADFHSENADAETGDVFLQCCLFGDVIYG